MTCVVVALAGERAHVFADTSHLGPRGRLAYVAPKIQIFGAARFALVVRGAVFHCRAIGLLARLCHSHEDARERLSRALCGPVGRLLALAGPFECYLAGIAASGAPAAFMLVSHRKHPGVEPWTPIDIPYAVSTGPAPEIVPTANPVAFGVRAAQLQRGVLQRLPFARSPVSIVGGALQHVEIDRNGVRSQILGGWFDRLGERLNASASFSQTGASVRPWRRRNPLAWFMPTSTAGTLRMAGLVYIGVIAARLAWQAPGIVYIETTYGSAPQAKVETAAGTWDTRSRLDLGKLITGPAMGREALGAFSGHRTSPADHAEAARQALAETGRDCVILSSREVLLDEFEHALECK